MQRSRPKPAPPRRARNEEEADGRRRIVHVCRRMYERGLIAGTDGDVSVRLTGGRVLITPSGVHRGDLVEEDLVVVDGGSGQLLKGDRRPSSELLMHLLCYEVRAEVNAVVRARPVHAAALAMAGVSVAHCILPEPCLSLGLVFTAPHATPGTEDVPRALRDLVARASAVLLDRHGALTVGPSLAAAYDRLESVEHAARITHAARCLGEARPLSERHVERLREAARKYGWAEISQGCDECNACPNGRAVGSADREAVGAQIDDAIARFLRS